MCGYPLSPTMPVDVWRLCRPGVDTAGAEGFMAEWTDDESGMSEYDWSCGSLAFHCRESEERAGDREGRSGRVPTTCGLGSRPRVVVG
jgi:hypothetical protein